jgi:hypothetical protein
MRWIGVVFGGLLMVASGVSSSPVDARRSAMTTPPGRPGVEVDLQLVLAVDVSLSMDNEEQQLQRQAYVAAFRDRLVHEAIRSGASGRIAVIYVEWSGDEEQRVVVPWTMIDSPEAAATFATSLETAPISRMRRTSISSAMAFAARLFEQSAYTAPRRVIDFSGDGSNNEGPPINLSRDEAVARGVVINGLPLVLDRTGTQMIGDQTVTLEMYYEQCVIGGAGSFLIPVREMGEFRDALKTKLILEIASIQPDPDHLNVIPASDTPRPGLDCNGRFSF